MRCPVIFRDFGDVPFNFVVLTTLFSGDAFSMLLTFSTFFGGAFLIGSWGLLLACFFINISNKSLFFLTPSFLPSSPVPWVGCWFVVGFGWWWLLGNGFGCMGGLVLIRVVGSLGVGLGRVLLVAGCGVGGGWVLVLGWVLVGQFGL